MQKLKDIELDTLIVVTHGIKATELFVTDKGLLNKKKEVIYKRVFNSGCYGYFINRKFKAESKLNTYPVTEIILINAKLPF